VEKQKFLIIGAGIGGLAVAAALRQQGHEFEIFEAADTMRHGGAGIAIWANALHALRSLGMKDTPPYFKTNHNGVAIRTASGKTIMSADADDLAQRYGALSAVLHREHLHELLWNLAGKPTIHCSKQLVRYAQNKSAGQAIVTAIFADGSTAEGHALVGCDGAGSAVRRQMLGDKPPRYSGYTAWRGIADLELKDSTPGESWGKGMRFGFFPLHDGRAYWFATRNAPAAHKFGTNMRHQLLDWFGDWHEPIGDLIRQTPETEILLNDIYDRNPVKNWCDGNVIILGDAAHPTTPNLGQGGCMAIEDAVTLGKALAAESDLATAFAACNRQRHDRTASLVLRARRIGAVGQWSSAPAIVLRTFLMRTLGARMQTRELDAVIGYRV
jgi:2-polyprenyl-6-methoxyphenol hydroxylase-like FAD-dependent oxidoreductase